MILSELSSKERPLLFGLPFSVEYQDQIKILEYAYSNSNSWSGQVQVWDDDKKTYDPGGTYFGRIQVRKLSQQSIDTISHTQGLNVNWLNWAARLDPKSEWEWVDTPITTIVKKYTDQISHLYKKFNRVLILVQNIGEEIPLHTDKVSKNSYNNEIFSPGPVRDLHLSVNDFHQKNRYLALKWSISEKENDKGMPIIRHKENTYQYDPKDNLFAINEVDMEHGAKKVFHKRGVIFLDGVLNYDNILKEKWIDLELKKI